MPRRLSLASVVRFFRPRWSISSTGQSSHILIRCTTRRSTIRRATDFRRSVCGMLPAKYDKAVECLIKDRDALLAFYDFPAEHWKHLRTTNPIESSFATVRHRTVRSKGCLSNKTALAMIFKLAEAHARIKPEFTARSYP